MAVLAGFLTLSPLAHANAQSWYLVTVHLAGGTDTGRVYVNLTAPGLGLVTTWCLNDSITHTKTILAAALTAVAAQSQQVFALLTFPDFEGNCIVHGLLAGPGP